MAHAERACTCARLRLANIRQLRQVRERTARELDDINELLSQLRTHIEVLRLSGDGDDYSRALVEEILVRVESIDQVLGFGQESAGVTTLAV